MGDDLGPPPPPKPVQMPPMPPVVAQKFGVAPGAPPPGTPMMMGGCPTVGGMGPNLVFNFCSPYGMAMAVPPPGGGGDGGGKEEKPDDGGEKKAKTVIVQGDPTWCQPRITAKKGAKLKDEPCVIM